MSYILFYYMQRLLQNRRGKGEFSVQKLDLFFQT